MQRDFGAYRAVLKLKEPGADMATSSFVSVLALTALAPFLTTSSACAARAQRDEKLI